MLKRMIPSLTILTVTLLSISACQFASHNDDADTAGDGEQATTTAAATIPYAPTAPGELPAALLGSAPAPRGMPVHYFPTDSATTGYLAVPAGEGPFPAVILIHEWNGLVNRVRQVADALAAEGYVALAADLYGGETGGTRDENVALMREVRANEDVMIANLNAAVNFLRARDDVTGRVATMGWCFGGGVALGFALGGVHHQGTAMFYGSLVQDPEVLQSIDHPIYGTFAELDGGIPPEEVARFAEALRAAGVPNDIHVYDAVGHGFWLWVDEDPAVRTEPATDAWTRLKAYLERVL